LTGDKRETAINIAQSSGLCNKSTRLLILDKVGLEAVIAKLKDFNEAVLHFLNVIFSSVFRLKTFKWPTLNLHWLSAARLYEKQWMERLDVYLHLWRGCAEPSYVVE
jgi:hypothetical protein